MSLYARRKARYLAEPEYREKHLAQNRAWRLRKKEHLAEYRRDYRAGRKRVDGRLKDEEQKRLTAERWHLRKPEWTRQWRLKKLERLAGRSCPERCEICGKKAARRRLHFDHCHTTNEFRGWICQHCNHAIGHMLNDPKIARAIANYLERAHGGHSRLPE